MNGRCLRTLLLLLLSELALNVCSVTFVSLSLSAVLSRSSVCGQSTMSEYSVRMRTGGAFRAGALTRGSTTLFTSRVIVPVVCFA